MAEDFLRLFLELNNRQKGKLLAENKYFGGEFKAVLEECGYED